MRNRFKFRYPTLVTGMHLNKDFGSSVELIHSDNIPVSATASLDPTNYSGISAWSVAIGTGLSSMAIEIERLNPDIILLFGDRAETLACCIAAAYMGVLLPMFKQGINLVA